MRRGLDDRTPEDIRLYFRDHHNSLNTLGASQSFLEILRATPRIEAGFSAHWTTTRRTVEASARPGVPNRDC